MIIIIGSSFEPNHNFGFLSSQSQNSSLGKFSCKNKIIASLLQEGKVVRFSAMVVVFILPHAEFGRNDHREDATTLQFSSAKYDDEVKIVKLIVWIFSEYVHMYAFCSFRLTNIQEIDI